MAAQAGRHGPTACASPASTQFARPFHIGSSCHGWKFLADQCACTSSSWSRPIRASDARQASSKDRAVSLVGYTASLVPVPIWGPDE